MLFFYLKRDFLRTCDKIEAVVAKQAIRDQLARYMEVVRGFLAETAA